MTDRAEHAPSLLRAHSRKRARDGVAITANIAESKKCAWDNKPTPYLFSVVSTEGYTIFMRYRKCATCLNEEERAAVSELYGVLGRVK